MKDAMRRAAKTLLFALVPYLPASAAQPIEDFVFRQPELRRAHAATILETKDGGMLAAWLWGENDGAVDIRIFLARRTKAGWSEPEEVGREPGFQCRNPVLFRGADGVVWLSYKVGRPDNWNGAFRTSRDDGRTWSPVLHLPAGLYGPIKNKPLVLSDGTIVSGVSVETVTAWSCWVERSSDNGKTWTKHGPIIFPGVEMGIIQPSIVPIAGNKLRMFVRSTDRIGKICYADSADQGRTWTDAKPTALPNPNSGIDAVRLRDGRIVMVYNHTTKGRYPLNVAASRDDGLTWNKFLTLESVPGEYSYPAVIQASDGNIHTIYTWKPGATEPGDELPNLIKHVEIPLALIP